MIIIIPIKKILKTHTVKVLTIIKLINNKIITTTIMIIVILATM